MLGAFVFCLIVGIVLINLDDIKAVCSAFCSAQQETVTVTAGEDVTIPCTSVAAYPGWTGPEMYNGIAINYNNPGQSNFANPNIPQQKKARLDWASDNRNLIIKNVAVTDKGLYTYGGVQINLLVRDDCRLRYVGVCFGVAFLGIHIAPIVVVCVFQWCPPGVWALIVAPCIIDIVVMIVGLIWKYGCNHGH